MTPADPILVTNAVVVTPERSSRERCEILVRDGSIVSIEPAGATDAQGVRVIDAAGGIVLAGLTDGHIHSHELYMRGRVWGLPLEPYILRISPRFTPEERPTEQEVYDRTLAAAVDLMLGGVTNAVDDVEHPAFEDRYVDAVVQAYEDSGLRAWVSILTEDRGWIESIPFMKDLLPAELQPLAGASGALTGNRQAQLDLYRRSIERWQSRSGRVGVLVSPSAPQRCDPDFIQELFALAGTYDVPFHVHVQESLAQAASGPLFYGKSMVQYIAGLGVLQPRTMIAHGIWLDDEDIGTIAAAGATVVHNPASNLKLGSGVARVRDLLDAGVNVALGCDGYTCNDAQDIFDAMKLAASLSCIANEEPEHWLTPAEALRMGTVNGALGSGRPALGRLEVGAPADLVVLDPLAPAFVPLGDPLGQLVYAGRRGDVRTVIVGGRVLVEERRVPHIDVPALYGRVHEASERIWRAAQPSLAENAELLPYFLEALRRCRDLLPAGVYRHVPDGREFVARRV